MSASVYGRRGMVATSQPLAVATGLAVLDQGGNAVDAAVATAAALAVTEPTSTGMGGDCFAIVRRASGEIFALNGSGRAPENLTLALLADAGFDADRPLPPFHAHNVTVPGACRAWEDLLDRHGRRALSEVLEPARRLADEGFPVAPVTAASWARQADRLAAASFGGAELLVDGRAPRPGGLFVNPGMARTLRVVQQSGADAFYQGDIAASIVDAVGRAGGVLGLDDLERHESTWVEPISLSYRGATVYECPPNGQGLAALIALGIVSGFALPSEPLSADRLHLLVEAMRLGWADARRYIADPEHAAVPVEHLLGDGYLEQRRALIHPKRCQHPVPGPISSSDTVYLCTADQEGNVCSMICSNYNGFGTGIVPTGWGFSLQNRGAGFSLDPTHANVLAPGKRPYHTIIPGLVELGDGTVGPFGVMGGFMQPQGHLQVVVGLVDDDGHHDPQSVLDRPRFCIEAGIASGRLALEEGVPEGTMATLAERGHDVRRVSGMSRTLFGRGQIILRRLDGVLVGGSDRRADGCAMPLS